MDKNNRYEAQGLNIIKKGQLWRFKDSYIKSSLTAGAKDMTNDRFLIKNASDGYVIYVKANSKGKAIKSAKEHGWAEESFLNACDQEV